MGIRFRCHHCDHELHVKDFQAGKRGRCPQCEGRFRIPLQDAEHSLDVDEVASALTAAAKSSSPQRKAASSNTAADGKGQKRQKPQSASKAKRRKEPKKSGEDQSGLKPASPPELPANPVAVAPADSSSLTGTAPPGVTNSASVATEAAADSKGKLAAKSAQPGPLKSEEAVSADAAYRLQDENEFSAATISVGPGELSAETAEDVYWYVRPPSGGQYGPATTAVLQQWIAERRVTPDTLVWRDGWSDWISAAIALPALAGDEQMENAAAADLVRPASSDSKQSGALTVDESTSASTAAAKPQAPASENASSLRPSLSERNRLDRRQRRKRNYLITLTLLSVVAVILIVALVVALLVPR